MQASPHCRIYLEPLGIAAFVSLATSRAGALMLAGASWGAFTAGASLSLGPPFFGKIAVEVTFTHRPGLLF